MISEHRTHHNNQLRIQGVNSIVELKGWVAKKRNLGSLVFIDLRDKEGITQLVCDEKFSEITSKIKNEYVIYAKGKVIERVSKNKNIPTGDIEVEVSELEIINRAETTPMIVAEDTDALEDTRLKYRYLDLRRPSLQKALRLRYEVTKSIRAYFDAHQFMEIETPIIAKTTPEGARDYLIPSRVNKGKFYALPQSPQIFKQLLMIAGFERYFQIARCFRDEDLRADRQMEFTQVDFEVSFFSQEEFYSLVEGLFVKVLKDVKNIDIQVPFQRLTWHEAMNMYGSDKPDLRYDLPLVDISEILKDSEIAFLQNETTKAIKVENSANIFTRKEIDTLTETVKKYKAKGLCFVKYTNQQMEGTSAKLLTEKQKQELIKQLDLKENDVVFFVNDTWLTAVTAMGALRIAIAKKLQIIPENVYKFLWIMDFPMYEYNEEERKYDFGHNPFSMPQGGIDVLTKENLENVLAYQFDFVCNGEEMCSGAIRNHDIEVMKKAFDLAGYTEEDVKTKFRSLYTAFQYGAPPHGGMAPGIDRMLMLLRDEINLREVQVFPPNVSGMDNMMGSPSPVSEQQLREVHIKVR